MRHSACAELCLDFALGQCSEEHNCYSTKMDVFHKIRKEVEEALEGISDLPRKALLSKSWQQIVAHHKEYLAHIVRTKQQGSYYRYVLANLCPGEIVVIIDYKMKVELGLRTRENQREWYGKRGISLHGFLVIAQVGSFWKIELSGQSGNCECKVMFLCLYFYTHILKQCILFFTLTDSTVVI